MNEQRRVLHYMLVGLVISLCSLLLLNLQAEVRADKGQKNTTELAAKKSLPAQDAPLEEVRAIHHNANIPSAVQVQVAKDVLCLFVLLRHVDIEYAKYKPEVPLPLSKHFLTLFRAIISPNAP